MSSKWIVLFLLLAGIATWAAFRVDQPVRDAIIEAQGKNWRKTGEFRFYSAVRKYGDWPPLMAAAGLALVLVRLSGSRRWSRILVAAMVASTLAGILANASRLTTGRTRPRESPKIEQGFYGPVHEGKILIGQPGYNSFPSGHTATAFGFALVFLIAAPLPGVLVVIGAGLVAWASIALGAHHPSDITVSIFLSAAVAWFVWRWMQGRGGERVERLLRFPAV